MRRLAAGLLIALSCGLLVEAHERGPWYVIGRKPDATVYPGPTERCPSGTSASVVPCAFGYGMNTRAAYGCGSNPTILRVRNLNDSGTDSLRAAMETTGPRIVIFEISGTIILDSDISVTSPCLTVAGQTAPSPGITLRSTADAAYSGGGINVYSHDVLIQHLRVRPGDGGATLSSSAAHMGIMSYLQNSYNIVVDHCSVSWAGGKNMLFYSGDANGASPANSSFWRSITSEALFRARNVTDDWAGSAPSSLGMLIAGLNPTNTVSVIGSLFAHNADRNPELGEGTYVQFINNVVYDFGNFDPAGGGFYWGSWVYAVTPSLNTRPSVLDLIGNVYIAGSHTPPATPVYAIGAWAAWSGSALYHTDTVLDQTAGALTLYDTARVASTGFDIRVASPSLSISGYTILAGSATKAFVLANAGARPSDRDTVDTRIVTDVTNRTGTVITSQTEVGGWPTLAVNTRTLTTPATPHHVNASGYTDMEVWLHGYADGVEPAS